VTAREFHVRPSRRASALLAVLLAAGCASVQTPRPAPSLPSVEPGAAVTGVASVIDGDTIEIHGQRIRLHGIDAPESSQLCELNGKPWRCGQSSANALADHIGRRTVTCEPRTHDRYGRLVAACSVAGTSISGWMQPVPEDLGISVRGHGRRANRRLPLRPRTGGGTNEGAPLDFGLACGRQSSYAAARGGGGAHGGGTPVIHCLPCFGGEPTVPAARE
jgi:hypothetical protein